MENIDLKILRFVCLLFFALLKCCTISSNFIQVYEIKWNISSRKSRSRTQLSTILLSFFLQCPLLFVPPLHLSVMTLVNRNFSNIDQCLLFICIPCSYWSWVDFLDMICQISLFIFFCIIFIKSKFLQNLKKIWARNIPSAASKFSRKVFNKTDSFIISKRIIHFLCLFRFKILPIGFGQRIYKFPHLLKKWKSEFWSRAAFIG